MNPNESRPDWFAIDAHDINPMFVEQEYFVFFHPKFKGKPTGFFTPAKVEKLIRKDLAYVVLSQPANDDQTNER